jgi:hypothetical protein
MILNNARRSSVLQSKVVTTYNKFLQTPPIQDPAFYADLLTLAVDREFLMGELDKLPTEALLGPLKVCTFSCIMLPPNLHWPLVA